MYERFRDNPAAVSEQWREFFSDYKPGDAPRAATSNGFPNGNGATLARGVAGSGASASGGAKRDGDDTFPMR
ncbi:MAG: hypothetical protein EBV14_01745, partial [Actinobacteria bacterium]|nr:hypothetical protein [Actinomycetota bacterium]